MGTIFCLENRAVPNECARISLYSNKKLIFFPPALVVLENGPSSKCLFSGRERKCLSFVVESNPNMLILSI